MRPRLAPGGAGGRSRANETNDNYDTVAHHPRNAAAWTYVAAFITSLVYVLWHLLPLLTGRQRD